MKKIMMFLAAALMVLVMGCASAGSQAQSAKSSDGAGKPAAPAAAQKKPAVVYFSATGNTRSLAETAARALKADLIEIKPAQPYTEAELDYTSSGSRVSKEHAAGNARPAVAEQADLSGCQSVVVAYPIWWGEAPGVVYTFVEKANLSGKNIGAICTSASSSIGQSGENVAKAAGGRYVGGQRFRPDAPEAEIRGFFSGKL